MNKLLRVGIYLRLSNEDRDKVNKDDASESIKNQRNMLIDYVNKHSNFILIDEYCDEDLSGAGTFRPEFERLIKDCENRKIDVVLCKSQSRFSRDMEIVERYINNKFREWNIRFIGLSDNADTQNYGNKKARQINGLVNEWYLEDVSNNIRYAFNSKMKQGEFISPFAPFGYDISCIDNNKLVIDIVAANTVVKIYDLYLKGFGYSAIANYLNSNNIASPSYYKYLKKSKLNIVSKRRREEIKWSSNAIKKILTNEVYIGNLIQGKRTTVSYKNHKIRKKNKEEWIKCENTHEKIIDEKTFFKVQKIIQERRKSSTKTGSVHIFSGKVFCMECNNYMRKKNSSKHEYLTCSNNCNGYNECCNKTSIRYDKLENIILNSINDKIKKYYDKNILNKLNLDKKNSISNNSVNNFIVKKKEVENKISITNNYLKNLYEDKVNGIINEEQFIQLLNSFNKEISFFNNQIKFINSKIKYYKENKENNYKMSFDNYKEFKNLDNIILDEFIDKIYIGMINKETNIRNIQIKWNF